MTLRQKLELRQRTHLEIACSAAVAAGLAPDEAAAIRTMPSLIETHGEELKQQWYRQRGGGTKGWHYFLRTYGYEEKLIIVRSQPPASRTSTVSEK